MSTAASTPGTRANAAALWRGTCAMARAFAAYAGRAGLGAAALVAAAAALDGASILLLVPVLNIVVGGGHGEVAARLTAFGAATPFAQLALLVAAFLAVALLRAAVTYARDVALARLQAGFVEAERNRVITRLAQAPWPRVAAISHMRVASLLSQEVSRVGATLQTLLHMTVAFTMLAVQGAIALALAPLLTLSVMLCLFVAALLFLAASPGIRALGGEMVQAGQAMMAGTGAFLAGLKAAAAQGARGHFLAEHLRIQARVRSAAVEFARRQSRSQLGFGVGAALLAGLVVLLGFGWFGVAPELLITVLVIFARMQAPAILLFQSAQSLAFYLPSFETIRGFDAELGETAAIPEPVPPPPGALVLSDATYAHAGGRGVEGASLTVPPGAFAGIAGPSGAGKTTLVDLIVGLVVPQSGSVSVGGVALDAGARAGWAASAAYVPQDGFLFHDTVRRNLTWSSPGASDAAIAEALDAAGATAIVARLASGLETVIGERGNLLSGGERQRLGIARALLARPRLLVLDEALSAIDAAGEAELLSRLAALDPRPTILMITHREDSLRWCDLEIRVAEGRVRAVTRP
ncbi:ATP-binding cassette domain-containing protein [Sphingomonas koreensis]